MQAPAAVDRKVTPISTAAADSFGQLMATESIYRNRHLAVLRVVRDTLVATKDTGKATQWLDQQLAQEATSLSLVDAGKTESFSTVPACVLLSGKSPSSFPHPITEPCSMCNWLNSMPEWKLMSKSDTYLPAFLALLRQFMERQDTKAESTTRSTPYTRPSRVLKKAVPASSTRSTPLFTVSDVVYVDSTDTKNPGVDQKVFDLRVFTTVGNGVIHTIDTVCVPLRDIAPLVRYSEPHMSGLMREFQPDEKCSVKVTGADSISRPLVMLTLKGIKRLLLCNRAKQWGPTVYTAIEESIKAQLFASASSPPTTVSSQEPSLTPPSSLELWSL